MFTKYTNLLFPLNHWHSHLHRFIFKNEGNPETLKADKPEPGEPQKNTDKKPPDKPTDKENPNLQKPKAERGELTDAPAKDATSLDTLDKQNPAGKIHKRYFDKIKATPEESAEKDREELKAANIEDIRFNSRLLKKKAEKEDDPAQAAGIKEETQRRIKAYTSSYDEGWYTINYQRMGSDKRGRSHENNIGLGDVLLDTDIKNILVMRENGTVIKTHRGVVPSRQQYSGRQAFLDENNEYVATFTGEKFRILDENETDFKDPKALKKYLGEFAEDEKIRANNKETFNDEMSTWEDQDVYYVETELDPNKSVVEQLKAGPKFKFTASQRAMCEIIEEEFKAAGMPNSIIAAAIINAHSESGLKNIKAKGSEESYGLFQINIPARKGRVTAEDMLDPRKNCQEILKEVAGKRGSGLRSRAQAGASVTELAALFSRDIERPADKYGAMQRRSKQALAMFGERVRTDQEEVAYRINSNEKGSNGKGILKLRSSQDTWIFGSSGAVAMNALSKSLNLGNTGFFGIVGIHPMKFREKLKETWSKIAQLKLPKQVVLVGMAANGLGSDSDKLIQKNLDAYAGIKQFLEEKGVKVKIATVQPAAGLGEQISRFNDKLREKYQSDTLIDIAKYTTTPDGKHINEEFASSDGIHLSKRGYHKMAEMIKESAEKERTT